MLAAEQGIEPDRLGYRRDKALAIAHSQRLGHTVGVNGFFTPLAAHARQLTAAPSGWPPSCPATRTSPTPARS